jgi:hypothetical protein
VGSDIDFIHSFRKTIITAQNALWKEYFQNTFGRNIFRTLLEGIFSEHFWKEYFQNTFGRNIFRTLLEGIFLEAIYSFAIFN